MAVGLLLVFGSYAVSAETIVTHAAAETQIASYPQQMWVKTPVTVELQYRFVQYVPSPNKTIQIVTYLIRSGMGWQIIEAKNVAQATWSSGIWYNHTAQGAVPNVGVGTYGLYVKVWWTEYVGTDTYVYYSSEDSRSVTVSAVTYTLSAAVSPSGSGSVGGAGSYQEGASVTVSASPASGYQFSSWSGYISGTGNPKTFTMPAQNVTITANFTLAPPPSYTLSTSVSPSASGIVTGGGSYQAGDSVLVTAIPSDGYEFSCWSNYLDGTENPRSFTMPAQNVMATAVFVEAPDPEPDVPVSDVRTMLFYSGVSLVVVGVVWAGVAKWRR